MSLNGIGGAIGTGYDLAKEFTAEPENPILSAAAGFAGWVSQQSGDLYAKVTGDRDNTIIAGSSEFV